MLDVLVGIGFTSVMIVLIVWQAVRMDREQPWFLAFTHKEKAGRGGQRSWQRKT